MLKKVFNIINSFFTNHRKFLYLVKHYLNGVLSKKKSLKICQKNNRDYERMGISKLGINTYDGSNQFTHPDSVFFNGKYWLVMTPYPYGMEAYENPCLYSSCVFSDFNEQISNPISDQGVIRRGNHLSDPFFCLNDKELLVLYRKNERLQKGEIVGIYYRVLNSNKSLSEEQCLISGTENFLSPIMFKENQIYHFQYMNKTQEGSEIKELLFDNELKQIQTRFIDINGFPNDYYFWHFGLKHNDDSGKTKGLVLIRHKQIEKDFLLCEAEYDQEKLRWNFVKFVDIPSKLKSNIMHVYKSCYVPNDHKILLSYKDKKGRYYCSLIEC